MRRSKSGSEISYRGWSISPELRTEAECIKLFSLGGEAKHLRLNLLSPAFNLNPAYHFNTFPFDTPSFVLSHQSTTFIPSLVLWTGRLSSPRESGTSLQTQRSTNRSQQTLNVKSDPIRLLFSTHTRPSTSILLEHTSSNLLKYVKRKWAQGVA